MLRHALTVTGVVASTVTHAARLYGLGPGRRQPLRHLGRPAPDLAVPRLDGRLHLHREERYADNRVKNGALNPSTGRSAATARSPWRPRRTAPATPTARPMSPTSRRTPPTSTRRSPA
ncbi:hypothetical protein ACRAWF_06120 [Streptomyces sp. L7]